MIEWLKIGFIAALIAALLAALWFVFDKGQQLATAREQLSTAQATIKVWHDAADRAANAAIADASRAKEFADKLDETERLKEEALNENAKKARIKCLDRDDTHKLRDYFDKTGDRGPAGSTKDPK